LTAGAHYLLGGIRPEAEGEKVLPSVKAHLAILLAAILAVRAWGYWLDRFQLNYSPRGTVTGASYTDINAELPALYLLIGATVVAIGTALIAAAEDRLHREGVEYLQVKTLGPSRPSAHYELTRRFYEKVGFRRVGVLREYERNADGQWQDCLLMDLIKADLRWRFERGERPEVVVGQPPLRPLGQGERVEALPILMPCEAYSINSPGQLKEVEQVMSELGYTAE
jgi:GNAT superfamily N-acetyltransferase